MFLNTVGWFSSVSPEWAVFFLSMIPITELRASIPVGIEIYHLAIWKVWFISIIGDFIPALFILYLIPIFHDWLLQQKFIGNVFKKKLKKAQKAFEGKYAKYGVIGLIIFVGIPLPFTGSWTGSLAAFIFNIPFKKSWPLIFAGVCIAATLMVLITVFAGGTLRWLF